MALPETDESARRVRRIPDLVDADVPAASAIRKDQPCANAAGAFSPFFFVGGALGGDTRLTAGMICSWHKEWLVGIYPWAGKYRNVELAKGGFRWPPAYLVPRHMEGLESGLLAEYTPCRPAPLPEVATRIAMVHAELLLIHPFRDGNGRLARWVAALMAVQAGCPLPEFRFAGRNSRKESEDYLASVQKGYVQDYLPLADFFENAIRRRMEAGS